MSNYSKTYITRRKAKWEETVEEKISKIINKKYSHFYRHTKDYVRSYLLSRGKLNINFSRDLIVKEDIIEQYVKSRENTNNIINYDFSNIPEVLRKTDYFTLICTNKNIHGEILGEFQTNFKRLVKQKIDIDNFDIRVNYSKQEASKKFSIFKEKFNELYGTKFSLKFANFINLSIPIKIYCKKCNNYFWRKPTVMVSNNPNSLRDKCPYCSHTALGISYRLSQENWISKAKEKFGDTLDFSKVEYVNSNTKVEVICNTCHNSFLARPNDLLHQVYGCPVCSKIKAGYKLRNDEEDFINRAKEVWGSDIWDYSKINYTTLIDEITIIDRKTGEEFKQIAQEHLSGIYPGNKKNISSGEFIITTILDELGLEFTSQYSVIGKIEGRASNRVIIDFRLVLDDKEYWIEYNGQQHYSMNGIEYFCGSEDTVTHYQNQIRRDQNVRNYCKDNEITLIEIPYTYKTYNQIGDILKAILLEGKSPGEIIDSVIPQDIT